MRRAVEAEATAENPWRSAQPSSQLSCRCCRADVLCMICARMVEFCASVCRYLKARQWCLGDAADACFFNAVRTKRLTLAVFADKQPPLPLWNRTRPAVPRERERDKQTEY
ncbi:hypothetical protein V5799_005136 [Amblyomma americanum]|uniref:Uncharacterized protein n=1 Tax=Amblyomma americanum TaxID=6943 RepID=A0AAQ4E043_AMBAM